MTGSSAEGWEYLIDYTRFGRVTATTGGNKLLDNPVPEDRVYYPFVMVLSDTSGAANSIDIGKVEEDGSTTSVIQNFNLDANETRVLEASSIGVIFPRVEGGANVEFTAGSDSVEVTMFYFPNEV